VVVGFGPEETQDWSKGQQLVGRKECVGAEKPRKLRSTMVSKKKKKYPGALDVMWEQGKGGCVVEGLGGN